MENLNGLKVAILVTDGFEQVELTEPRKALDQAGAQTSVASSKEGRVRGWKFTEDGQAKIAFLPLLPHASYRRSALQAMYRKMEEEIENLTHKSQSKLANVPERDCS
jgi:putative intracellular protease/amidase